MNTKQKIINILKETFATQQLKVIDDSAKHAEHIGSRPSGETHFSVFVVSKDFEGKTLLTRHRMINDALKQELKNQIHALSIKALTPAECSG